MTRHSKGTDWIGLLSFGFFLLIVGGVWLSTPNLADETIDFFKGFELQNVTSNILLPAPKDVYSHTTVYTAAMQFCIVFAIFEIAILVLRFIVNEPISRKGETAGSIAFWFGAAYFLSLLINQYIGWFALIAGLILSGGMAIIVSNIIKLIRWHANRSNL